MATNKIDPHELHKLKTKLAIIIIAAKHAGHVTGKGKGKSAKGALHG